MLVSLLAFLLGHFGHIRAAVEFSLEGEGLVTHLAVRLLLNSFDLRP